MESSRDTHANRSIHGAIYSLALLLTAALPAAAQTENFTVTVSRAAYDTGPGGLFVDDTFDTDTDFGPLIDIGASAITDPLDVDDALGWWRGVGDTATETGGLTGGTDSKLQFVLSGDRFDDDNYATRDLRIDSVWAPYVGTESTVEVAFESFDFGSDTPNVAYGFNVEIENPALEVTFSVSGTWFTGTYGNQTFDHGLAIQMLAENDSTGESLYDSGLTFISGTFTPTPPQVALGMELIAVSGDTQFTGWYSIATGLPEIIDTTTVPGIEMLSYTQTEPGFGVDFQYVPIPGDFDFSGAIDADDIDALFARDGQFVTASNQIYDLISDNFINATPNTLGSDTDILVKLLLNTEYGDATLDGQINPSDLAPLTLNWLATGKGWADGDFNGDGLVNPTDLSALTLNWLFDNGAAPTPTPEPTSLALLALASLARMRRRR